MTITNDVTTIKNLQFAVLEQSELNKIYRNGYFIPLIRNGEWEVIKKIFDKSEFLDNFCDFLIKGNINAAYIEPIVSEEITDIKLLRGNNISRYSYSIKDTKSCLNNLQVKNILSKNSSRNLLVMQNITGTTDKNRFHCCLFKKPENYVFVDTTNIVAVKDKYCAESILAIVNSKLIDWFFRKTSTNNHVNGYEVEQLPIPKISAEQQQPFVKLVDYILFIKKQPFYQSTDLAYDEERLMANFFENLIDALVYELYFPDELHEAGKYFISLIEKENLPDLNAIQGDKISTLKQIIQRLTDKNHPLYINLFFLDSVPVVRVIEGK